MIVETIQDPGAARAFWAKALLEMLYSHSVLSRQRGHWQMNWDMWRRLAVVLAVPEHLIPRQPDCPPEIAPEAVGYIFGRPVHIVDQEGVTFNDAD